MTRGQYSPNGNYPQELPTYWKFPDGTIRTDIPELSDEELEELGWYGPVEMPPFPGTSYYTHEYKWNPETHVFDVREFEFWEKKERTNYTEFFRNFLNTAAYSKIRTAATQSLAVNVYCTEFIALLNDAQRDRWNVMTDKIQELITAIFSNITLTAEELEEVQELFVRTGMSAIYTLG